jgi:hypothetical protein
MTTDTMTTAEIREKGIEALQKALGPVGTARFFAELKLGSGNYTEERREWVEKTSMDEILAEIETLKHKGVIPK